MELFKIQLYNQKFAFILSIKILVFDDKIIEYAQSIKQATGKYKNMQMF